MNIGNNILITGGLGFIGSYFAEKMSLSDLEKAEKLANDYLAKQKSQALAQYLLAASSMNIILLATIP